MTVTLRDDMKDSFWKPHRESAKRYMPAITNARWIRHFQLGSYRLLVGTDCDSIGSICYLHIMYVYRANDDTPYLAVSSEYAYELVSADSPCFCLFFGGKHFNMGLSPDYTDLGVFTQKALEAIIEPLEIPSSETPKELPLD